MLGSVEKITKFVLDLFFPVFCVGCGKEGRYICATCLGFVGEASLMCPVCETSTYTGETHTACKGKYTLDGLIGVWEYEGVIKQLLLRVKYGGAAHAAQETMELAFLAMAKDTARFSPFLSFLFSKDTVLTFVPVWKRKERKRGYNQAELIAIALSSASSSYAKTPQKLLKKIKDTKSQTVLKEKERLWNVKDSFLYKGETLVREGLSLAKVVLVDDIWTSGATMRECCKVLKKSGAKEVWGFTLARTV